MRYTGKKKLQLETDALAFASTPKTKNDIRTQFALSLWQTTSLVQDLQKQGRMIRQGRMYSAVTAQVEEKAAEIVERLSVAEPSDVLLILECLARCKGDREAALNRALAIAARLK